MCQGSQSRQLLNFQRWLTWFVTYLSISCNSRFPCLSIYFQTIARIWHLLLRLKAFFFTTTTLNSKLFCPHKRAGTWELGLFYLNSMLLERFVNAVLYLTKYLHILGHLIRSCWRMFKHFHSMLVWTTCSQRSLRNSLSVRILVSLGKTVLHGTQHPF